VLPKAPVNLPLCGTRFRDKVWKPKPCLRESGSTLGGQGKNDKVIFRADYPIGKNGLIRLKQFWEDSTLCRISYQTSGPAKLTIKSHDKNNLSIIAIMDKTVADKDYEWKQKSSPGVPWFSDTIQDFFSIKYHEKNENMFIVNQKEIIRGGNRLILNLSEPVEYYITIPSDADFETDFSKIDIVYDAVRLCDANKVRYTKLHVSCSHVNIRGYCGSSCNNRDSWDYITFVNNKTDPITDIHTKGNVILPTY
jgi:hypothetical protein